jgi:aminoglycoside phosphotransferase (APT) family kinase protein
VAAGIGYAARRVLSIRATAALLAAALGANGTVLYGRFCAEHSKADAVGQGRAMANDKDDGDTGGSSAYERPSKLAPPPDLGGPPRGLHRLGPAACVDSGTRARLFADPDSGFRHRISTAGISIRHRQFVEQRAHAEPSPPRSADPLLSEASGAVLAVTNWLRSEGVDVRGRPDIRRCDGGMSHLTYHLRYDAHDLVLRRPLPGQGGLQRMRREYALQAALRPHCPVADMVRLCADQAIVGTPFYVMRYVPGLVPRRRSFGGIALSAGDARQVCINLLEQMIALHRIDPRSLASQDLTLAPSSASHLRKLLFHWLSRHARLKTWNGSDLRPIGQWLIDHVPEPRHAALLHNDWRLDNIVFDAARPTRIRAVLDWEFASVGDPLMDLGILLSYWIEPGDNFVMRRYQWQPSHLPGMLGREELLDRYLSATARSAKDWAFYRIFGLFRYLLTLQELHHRHAVQGGEEKEFFRGIWVLTHYIHWKCRGLMRHA